MRCEGFQLIIDTSIDTSIIIREYKQIFYQQGVELNIVNYVIEFFFGENNNYQQTGNVYLIFEIKPRKS